jgi:hypothetical protein
MSVAASIDSAKQEAFVGQVLNDTSASMVTILAALGDRLGLFKTLAASGPATSAEVAALADEGGPMFFGGVHEMLLSASSVVDVGEVRRAAS